MALRQRVNANHANSKIASKLVGIEPVSNVTRRRALGEIGNKLPNLQNSIPVKKNGTLPERKPSRPLNEKPLAKIGHPPKNMPPPQARSAKAASTTALPIEEAMETSKLAANPVRETEKSSKRASRKSYSSKQLEIIDPDESSKHDPAMVCEYVEDIFCYLRSMENKFPIRKNFLEGHGTAPAMRKLLIDWIVEVHLNFGMLLETLHLCVAIIDRYLQENNNVGRGTLQLVGVTSLWIAAKYEESYIPALADFAYVCDNAYTKRQIMSAELKIVKQLNCSFGRPLSVHFLRRYNKVGQVQGIHHSLGKFLLELALMEYSMAHVNPSLQAAAACCLSLGIINGVMDLQSVWTPTLVHYTKYEYADIRNIIVGLANILLKEEAPKFQAIRKKYARSVYGKISLNPKLTGPLVRKLTLTK